MKRSKKRWDWTEKNLRKTRIKGKRHYPPSAPKWYCRLFHVREKNRTKKELRKVKFGQDPDNLLIFDRSNHRHIANWYWW